jgi:hypothetical protein
MDCFATLAMTKQAVNQKTAGFCPPFLFEMDCRVKPSNDSLN